MGASAVDRLVDRRARQSQSSAARPLHRDDALGLDEGAVDAYYR
jgi:hypothetical protein